MRYGEKKKEYLKKGLPLMKSGKMDESKWVRKLGIVASARDFTWVSLEKTKNRIPIGYHFCCDSRSTWRHKVNCMYLTMLQSNDLSDLKDIV